MIKPALIFCPLTFRLLFQHVQGQVDDGPVHALYLRRVKCPFTVIQRHAGQGILVEIDFPHLNAVFLAVCVQPHRKDYDLLFQNFHAILFNQIKALDAAGLQCPAENDIVILLKISRQEVICIENIALQFLGDPFGILLCGAVFSFIYYNGFLLAHFSFLLPPLFAQHGNQVIHIPVEFLRQVQCFLQIVCHDGTIDFSYGLAAGVLPQQIHRLGSCQGGQIPIPQCRASAPLQIGKNHQPGFFSCLLLNGSGQFLAGNPGTFRLYNDAVQLAPIPSFDDMAADLVHIRRYFRHKYSFRTAGKSRIQCDVAAVASHDFHHGGPVMSRGRIPQLGDGVQYGIDCRIKANRILGAGNI